MRTPIFAILMPVLLMGCMTPPPQQTSAAQRDTASSVGGVNVLKYSSNRGIDYWRLCHDYSNYLGCSANAY